MFREIGSVAIVCLSLILAIGGTSQANWVETFDNNTFDLDTWQFPPYPDIAKTFKAEIVDGPDDNDYLSLTETSSVGGGGAAFGAGFGSDEVFTDVRIGAVVNVAGDASRNYCGLVGRTTYIIDDGSASGAPGILATEAYVMHVNWEDGPANLRIDLEKIVMMQNIMRNETELGLNVDVPGLNHARSYYAEMDIIGADPVYITGSLYEYKGGPLVARTATMVDTAGNDPWEEEVGKDAPFTSGVSGIFAQNENAEPAGFFCTYDEVSSLSDGPAAVNPGPVNGSEDVPVNVTLTWTEAAFATGRELWFGKVGAMEKVDPAPAGATYTPGMLEFGQTYEWRVDQVGPSGIVTGRTWTFTAADYLMVEDFESYADDEAIQAAWPDNIEGFEYAYLDGTGNQRLWFEYQNQYEPFATEVTRTFDSVQDWTQFNFETLSLSFGGRVENVEQQMYLEVADAQGNSAKVPHPYTHACQSRLWREWNVPLSEISAAGVDLTQVNKLTLGFGDGTKSGQAEDDFDRVLFDNIRLYPTP